MRRWLVLVGVGVVGLTVGAFAGGGIASSDDAGDAQPDEIVVEIDPAEVPVASTRAPGDPLGANDLRYRPIEPCRFYDSRSFGPLDAGTAAGMRILGESTNLAGQGGPVDGCGVPDGALAAEVTLTAVGASRRGSLRMYPAGTAVPVAPSLTFSDLVLSSNTFTVAVCTSGCPGIDLAMRVTGASTDVVADVIGYWVPSLYAEVLADGSVVGGAGVASVTKVGTGQYDITFDRSIRGCGATASLGAGATFTATFPIDRAVSAATVVVNKVTVFTVQHSTGDPADAAFTAVVTC